MSVDFLDFDPQRSQRPPAFCRHRQSSLNTCSQVWKPSKRLCVGIRRKRDLYASHRIVRLDRVIEHAPEWRSAMIDVATKAPRQRR
jgi:hypothetical protein